MPLPEASSSPTDALAVDLEALERILHIQLTGHRELRACLEQKRESLRQADLHAITGLCQKESGIARRLGEAERQRLEIIRRLTAQIEPGAERPLTLKQIVEAKAPGPGGAALLELAASLREEVHTVRRESSIVTAAAEALRKHVTGVMQSVNRAISRVGTYERQGRIAVGSQMDFCVDLKSQLFNGLLGPSGHEALDMSLNGALHIGRSALVASQAGLQVTGNNMANAATEGFTRRSIHLSPLPGEVIGRGHIVGQGVQIGAIQREVDTALLARYRDAFSDEQAAASTYRFLSAVETLQNELTDNDLSSLLSDFFNSFSELANNPADSATRAVVIQQGESVANRIAGLRSDYDQVIGEVDRQLSSAVTTVNDILGQIEVVNEQILLSENGVGEASALRDRRDQLVTELAKHMDVDVIEHGSGSIDIHVDSIPIFLAGKSRGVEVRQESVNGQLEVSVRVAEDGTYLNPKSGLIGALVAQRDPTKVMPAIQTLEDLATQLIFQVNRVHSQGQAQKGFEAVTGTYAVEDTTVNLNSAGANLPFRIENGSFFVHVTHQATGQRTSHRIDVDGNAMTMDDLVNEINVVVGVPNVTASVTVEGALDLASAGGYEMSFSEDTSGALAALGINTFFDGKSANTIKVNDRLQGDPTLLAAGLGHVPGSNGTALAVANLQDEPVTELGGASLREFWQNAVNTLAVQTGAASAESESAQLVRDNLYTQLQAVSGVSLDEEAINLLAFQRQFQAAARFISVIDETLQVLIGMA